MKKTILTTYYILLATITCFFLPQVVFGATINSSNSYSYKQGVGINRGLVGHWTFDGADTTATQVLDKSGLNNTGTRAGGTSIINGKLGQAMKFDGSTGYVQKVGNLGISGNVAITISAWVKQSSFATDAHAIGLTGGTNTGGAYAAILLNDGGSGRVGFHMSGGGMNTDTGLLSLNKWYHLAAVKTPGVLSATTKVYINGVEKSTSNAYGDGTPNFASDNNFQVGAGWVNSADFPFGGLIDDVRVYSRALSSAEVAQLYAMGGGTKVNAPVPSYQTGGLKSGLVGHWTFDGADTTATQVLDKSGSNNTGTRYGGTSIINGKLGQAMKFNGTNGKVVTATLAGGTTNTVTFVAWVNAKTLGAYRGIFSKIDVYKGIILSSPAGNPLSYGWEGTSDEHGASTNLIITPGKWYLTAVVITPTRATVYLGGDGVLKTWVNVKTHNAYSLNTTWNIGVESSAANRWWDGSIDDVRIYSRALSAAEVAQLYTLGAGTKVNAPTPSYQTGGLKSGLVGHWTFDGADTTATQVLDKSGLNNTGTRAGGTSIINGKLGQAMKLAGNSSSYIRGTLNTGISGDATFSFSAWINTPNIIAGNYMTAVSIGTWGGGTAAGLFFNISAGSVTMSYGGSNVNTVAGVISANKWYHIVAVKTPGIADTTTKIYINGVLQGVSGGSGVTPNITNATPGIGEMKGYNAWNWNGSLDDVRVYSRALSAAEVQQLYQMGK